ncbi:isopenicillin N synthase family oxygenase [Elioraea sp.]|uniref:isopenicillin N synthase family dioxygenase n=1 Tax=Elioraea sp. TaxID=2185103 RepID=UPI0025BBE8EE|nr:2-oxoglutarate and iron-dependent oxygenase domain-containing protein [Elioraea sp.]
MSYATARSVDFGEIPVIDLAGLSMQGEAGLAAIGAAIRRAATEVGFFYIANHGVPQPVIDEAFSEARGFFRSPGAVKETARVNALHRGWLAPGGAVMDGAKRPDLKESFIFGLDLPTTDEDVLAGKPLMGPNIWPPSIPSFRVAMDAYYAAVLACGQRLLRGFAAALDLPPDHFAAAYRKPLARGSAIWYPPQPPELGESQFGVSAHSDYGCITILAQDDTGGLQVQNRAGEWIAAPPIPGTYVINIGDLMARWTNDLFVSTPHRVVNSSGRERQSIAVFYDPHPDTEVAVLPSCVAPGAAPAYEPTTCGAHILGRFARSFAYRKDPQPAS